MARVKRTENSRKEHICGKGNHVIPKGEPYLSASPGFRRRKPLIRCVNHPFRQSELTTSLRSEPLAAIEEFEDASAGFTSLEDLTDAWEQVVSALQEYVDTRQGALDEWENGNSQLEELVDLAQSALDEAEGWEPTEYNEDEPTEDDPDSWTEADNFEEAHAAWEEGLDEHLQEQISEAVDLANGLEL